VVAIGLGSPVEQVRKLAMATAVNCQLNKAGHNTLSQA